MKSKAIEYPHPVLNEYSNDFIDSCFSVGLVSHKIENDNISILLKPKIECHGIKKMLHDGLVKIIVRVVCDRTFYREIYMLNDKQTVEIIIPKNKVSDKIDIQSLIVAEKECDYNLPEFNQNYFSGISFKLRKGDVIAEEPGYEILLQEILKKPLPSLFVINCNTMSDEIRIDYPSNDKENRLGEDYIIISLPEKEYASYIELRRRISHNSITERILQNTIVLPVLVDSINILRNDSEDNYSETLWAKAIIRALEKHNIEDIGDESNNAVTLANLIFDDVVGASLESLKLCIYKLDNGMEEIVE